jgi:hypothetical protein
MNKHRVFTLAAALFAASQLVGCASINMSPPKAALETTAALRTAPLAPAAMGSFRLDASRPAAEDQSISMRGSNTVSSPVGGSFAQYLRESVKVELEAAGLYDPAASAVISGTLTRSAADAAVGTGKAQLGARFQVTRNGVVKFDQELAVDDSWESSFVGATAIPLAAAHYEGLYRKLAAKLLTDPGFRTAMARD